MPSAVVFRFLRLGLCLILLLGGFFRPAPATAGSSGWYEVRRGDNLTVIAKKFGVTLAELRRSNSLRSDVIHVGQKLTLANPFHRSGRKAPNWDKPCRRPGRTLREFGQYKRRGVLMPQTGVQVACPVGTALYVPADGIVRHVGALDGFGTLAIIEHAAGYATVLAPLDAQTLRIEIGEAVLRGDRLGESGKPVEDIGPYLHIELRKNDKAVRPDRLLK